MIQTQLLKLDPPYQIISARGYVGIQIATLIVTEQKEFSQNRFGHISNFIEYHSYPVVNYGLKQGLEEQMKYNNNHMDDEAEYAIRRRLQPEGAVWSGVEVKDVRVLGLAGAQNNPVGLDTFIWLIPTAFGYDPSLCIWNNTSTSRLYELYRGLGNVGLRTPKLDVLFFLRENDFPIELICESNPAINGYSVKVSIREDQDYEIIGRPDESIYFRCLIDISNPESISECASTIAEGLYGISYFLPTQNINLSWKVMLPFSSTEHMEAMKQLTNFVKERYKDLLYPHHD